MSPTVSKFNSDIVLFVCWVLILNHACCYMTERQRQTICINHFSIICLSVCLPKMFCNVCCFHKGSLKSISKKKHQQIKKKEKICQWTLSELLHRCVFKAFFFNLMRTKAIIVTFLILGSSFIRISSLVKATFML